MQATSSTWQIRTDSGHAAPDQHTKSSAETPTPVMRPSSSPVQHGSPGRPHAVQLPLSHIAWPTCTTPQCDMYHHGRASAE